MAEKRTLKFETVDDIVAEARRLLDSGYEAKGNWNLSQVCFHLIEWTRYPMDGFPTPPLFMRVIFGGMRMLGMIDRMTKRILNEGFQAGTPTAPNTVAKPDATSDADAVDQLAAVIERMKNHKGSLHKSPLFGQMDEATWYKVTLLHSEHHLGFLVPKTS